MTNGTPKQVRREIRTHIHVCVYIKKVPPKRVLLAKALVN
jgi:hypothetical protein